MDNNIDNNIDDLVFFGIGVLKDQLSIAVTFCQQPNTNGHSLLIKASVTISPNGELFFGESEATERQIGTVYIENLLELLGRRYSALFATQRSDFLLSDNNDCILVNANGHNFYVEELLAELLMDHRRALQQQVGTTKFLLPYAAVVALPNRALDPFRAGMLNACRIAGFQNVQLITHTSAVVIDHLVQYGGNDLGAQRQQNRAICVLFNNTRQTQLFHIHHNTVKALGNCTESKLELLRSADGILDCELVCAAESVAEQRELVAKFSDNVRGPFRPCDADECHQFVPIHEIVARGAMAFLLGHFGMQPTAVPYDLMEMMHYRIKCQINNGLERPIEMSGNYHCDANNPIRPIELVAGPIVKEIELFQYTSPGFGTDYSGCCHRIAAYNFELPVQLPVNLLIDHNGLLRLISDNGFLQSSNGTMNPDQVQALVAQTAQHDQELRERIVAVQHRTDWRSALVSMAIMIAAYQLLRAQGF